MEIRRVAIVSPLRTAVGRFGGGLSALTAGELGAVVLKALVEAGKLAPVIDRRFALSGVPDALRYQGDGHARGKIVIAV